MPRGAVFVPFCFYEAAANLLTNPVLDPFGKIPEFRVLRDQGDGGRSRSRPFSFGGGQILEGANGTHISRYRGRLPGSVSGLQLFGLRVYSPDS